MGINKGKKKEFTKLLNLFINISSFFGLIMLKSDFCIFLKSSPTYYSKLSLV